MREEPTQFTTIEVIKAIISDAILKNISEVHINSPKNKIKAEDEASIFTIEYLDNKKTVERHRIQSELGGKINSTIKKIVGRGVTTTIGSDSYYKRGKFTVELDKERLQIIIHYNDEKIIIVIRTYPQSFSKIREELDLKDETSSPPLHPFDPKEDPTKDPFFFEQIREIFLTSNKKSISQKELEVMVLLENLAREQFSSIASWLESPNGIIALITTAIMAGWINNNGIINLSEIISAWENCIETYDYEINPLYLIIEQTRENSNQLNKKIEEEEKEKKIEKEKEQKLAEEEKKRKLAKENNSYNNKDGDEDGNEDESKSESESETESESESEGEKEVEEVEEVKEESEEALEI